MKTSPRLPALAAVLAGSLLAVPGLSAQTLLLHYDFNTPNGATVADVSGTGNTGTLGGQAVIGNGGTGVSGSFGDRAFNNTGTAVMGAPSPDATGGAISTVFGTANYTSLTITLWYKVDAGSALGNSARLFNSSNTAGLLLAGTAANNLQLTGKSAGSVSHSTSATIGLVDEWVFVAVTYVGTDAGDPTKGTAKVYVGTTTTGVSEVSSVSATSIQGTRTLGTLIFGADSTAGNNRSFDGWLDDIRVYGETSGRDGALTLQQLEAVRLSSIPEPASATGLLAVFAAAATISLRRKTRNRDSR